MSIINEALKKAVREKGVSHSVAADEATVRRHIELEFSPKKSKFNWGPIFILLVLVLISGPIVAPLFSTPSHNVSLGTPINHTITQNISATTNTDLASASFNDNGANRKAQFAVEESPLFQGQSPVIISRIPDLNLSGIVYSAQQSYCIINNRIVKTGDTIQGAKLVNVSQNTVTLDYQGKEMMLSVSNN